MSDIDYFRFIFVIVSTTLYIKLSKMIKNKDVVDILCLMISSLYLSSIITLFLVRVYYEIQRFIWQSY